MNYAHLFRCCFISALERNYFTERWIGDQTLVTIFKNDHNLEFVSKRYINKHIPYLLFEGIYIHYERKRNMIDNDGKKVRAIFYFTREIFQEICNERRLGKMPTKTSYSYVRIEITQTYQKEHCRIYQKLM